MSFSVKKNNSQVVSSGNYFFYADASNNWTLSGNNIYNNNTGNVGINTSTPLVQFDVNGQTILRTPLVDIGVNAGQTLQKTGSIAIGTNAGQVNLGSFSVAIGSNAGRTDCGASNVSIGWLAGEISSGGGAVAIGNRANSSNSSNRTFGVYIGEFAGGTNAGQGAVAIGLRSGGTNQGQQAVAIGYNTAQSNQGLRAVAVGSGAGDVSQGASAVAIGNSAASSIQGSSSVCIGVSSGSTFQNSIVLNASGSTFVSDVSNGFFVRPIDVSTGTTNLLIYNSTSGKISYNTTKTFIIDHPIHENKYLVHACLEGPEAGVYYRGEAEITNNEEVEVLIPEYTSAFNNFTVHVSAAGSFNNLYATKVENGKFKVYGKNGKVSWTVFGTRQNIDTEPLKKDVQVSGSGPYKYIQ
jgi:hypothetical protein